MKRVIRILFIIHNILFINGFSAVDSVCPVEEKYNVTVQKPVRRTHRVRQYNWCLEIPPRCPTERIMVEETFETEIEEKTRVVFKCCPGYIKDELTGQCIKNCEEQCVHGTCNFMDTCICDAGYRGQYCDKHCADGYWGQNCGEVCQCLNGALCDFESGECTCTIGWTGVRCDVSCLNYTQSDECKDLFSCHKLSEKCRSDFLFSSTNSGKENRLIADKTNNYDERRFSSLPPLIPKMDYPAVTLSEPITNNYEPNSNIDEKKLTTSDQLTIYKNTDTFENAENKTTTFQSAVSGDFNSNTLSISASGDDSLQSHLSVKKESIYSYAPYVVSALGIAVFVIIAVFSFIHIDRFRKKKKMQPADGSTHDNIDRTPTVLFTANFHTAFSSPLPAIPQLLNPSYTTSLNCGSITKENCLDHASEVTSTYSLREVYESHYDHPQSSLYRNIEEHLYDEIPASRDPKPINRIQPIACDECSKEHRINNVASAQDFTKPGNKTPPEEFKITF